MLAAALLILAPAQSVAHLVDVDRAASLVDWEITSTSWTIHESPDKFRLDGSVTLMLDAASAPFTSGRLGGALMFTVPSALHGEIPNPIPFLPPLATFDIEGLQVTLSSAPFAIDPAGGFTTAVTLTTTAGTITTGGLLGSSTEPIFGVASPPTSVAGTVTQSGSVIALFVDLDVNVTQVIGSDAFTIVLDGPLRGNADVADADPPLLAGPMPLVVGASATLSASRLSPGRPTFLAGTLDGLGSTLVPQLGVTLALAAPVQVGGMVLASPSGAAAWTFPVPPVVAGRSVWFQAAQSGSVTQVFGTFAF